MSGSGPVDRKQVVAAVERYLVKRGVEAAPPLTSSVVDRFLAAKRSPAIASMDTVPQPAFEASAPAPAPPPLEIADFVCEEDVRKAIAQSKKIYIGPGSIVTPSARDLALRGDTLVVTEQVKTRKKSASE
jgi:hypothetical protein